MMNIDFRSNHTSIFRIKETVLLFVTDNSLFLVELQSQLPHRGLQISKVGEELQFFLNEKKE